MPTTEHEPDLDLVTGEAPTGLRSRTVAAAGWVAAAQLAQQLLTFGAAIVVTRLLTPSDYGLLGMVLVFTGYAAILKDINTASALIQRESLERRHTSSAFWFGLLVSGALTAIMIAAAPLVARFYGEDRVTLITIVIALNFPLVQLGSIQRALLSRNLQFKAIGIAETAGTAVGGVVAIAVAASGGGVWALVAQILVSSTVTSVAMWPMSSWRPSFELDRSALRELFGFTGGVLGSNLVSYTTRNVDNLLIGRFLSPRELGIYARCYSFMMFPLTKIVSVIGNVMFPSLSRLQGDRARVKRAYLRTIAVISLITFPLMLGLFVVADDFVLAAFGPPWMDMVPVLRILSLLGLVQSIGTTVGWIFLSQGRSGLQLKWALIGTPAVLGGIVIGVLLDSVVAVAAGYAIASAVFTWPLFAIPGRLIDMRVREVGRALAPTFACAVGMAAAVGAARLALPDLGPTPRLAVLVTVGAAAYAALLQLTPVPAYRELRELAGERLQRRRKTAAAR